MKSCLFILAGTFILAGVFVSLGTIFLMSSDTKAAPAREAASVENSETSL